MVGIGAEMMCVMVDEVESLCLVKEKLLLCMACARLLQIRCRASVWGRCMHDTLRKIDIQEKRFKSKHAPMHSVCH
jgi:hypothetical protein